MALDPAIRKNWIEIQRRYDYPVNAIGVRIPPGDQFTLKVWREEGLEEFMKGGKKPSEGNP
ncbi:MAG: hypothetical protein K0U98_15035 [Deltaproteobacteria bacterium]|nr:hypothetical protein [Deltaproteobacteria bacterium]